MRVYEEYMMFKTGVETMFPVGSLIFFKSLLNNLHLRSIPIYKENPHFCKNEKEKNDLKIDELMKNEPFTIMEIDVELIPGGGYGSSSFSLFFEYKTYFHIIQFDKIGWITSHVDATRYDEALKVLSKRIIFAKNYNED